MAVMLMGGTMTVELKDLTISYNRHPAIHHISGSFAEGSLTAVAGPNGAGKSTLLKGIAGILKPNDGEIIFHGLKKSDIAYLPQAAEIKRDFPLSILQFIITGFWRHANGFGGISKELREKAKLALASVGLAEFENRSIGSLSTGQFQRALFARLILQDAKLILLDEPFSAVDTDTTAKLMAIIRGWHLEKRTIICVLHDLAQIRENFPDCVLIARKCIAWEPTSAALDPEKLFKTKLFHEAWRDNAGACEA